MMIMFLLLLCFTTKSVYYVACVHAGFTEVHLCKMSRISVCRQVFSLKWLSKVFFPPTTNLGGSESPSISEPGSVRWCQH